MQILKKEGGFTLMEMLIVLGVMTIFITVISNILLVSASISQKFDTNLSSKSASNIAYSHIETTVKKNDVIDGIQIISDPSPSTTTQLRIVTHNARNEILHYYFDSSKHKVYFTASADTFGNVIKDEKTSMELADNVQSISFSMSGVNNDTLIIRMSTYIDKKATDLNNPDNLNTTTRNIFLKAIS